MSDQEAASLPWQVNLVCADARLTNGGLREKFLKNYADDPALQKAWRELFQEMEDIAQVGSLLRVEERFRQILSAARPHSVRGLDEPRQPALPGMPTPARQMRLGENEEADSWTPTRTLGDMLEELKAFARQALDEHDVNAQVFAAEAQKTLGLLDVLMQLYDVVVMNPPYGQALDWSIIPDGELANNNLYSAFILRARHLLNDEGYIGAITDRTFLLLYSFADFRNSVLRNIPILFGLDLGWGILDDANVATIASVYGSKTRKDKGLFINCQDTEKKEERFARELSILSEGDMGSFTYSVALSEFVTIPTHPFCYWAPPQVRQAFSSYKSLEPYYGIVRKGLSPGDTPRFVREHWEIAKNKYGIKWWAPYANGGPYSPYYRDNSSVVLWRNNGEEIKSIRPKSVVRSEQLYGQPGFTYGKRHEYFNVQVLEEGHIFSNEGYIIHCKSSCIENQLLAVLIAHYYGLWQILFQACIKK